MSDNIPHQHSSPHTFDVPRHDNAITPNTVTRWRDICQECAHAASERHTSMANNDVRVMVVTKFHAPQAVMPLVAAGCDLFAENMVQEGVAKWTAIAQTLPPSSDGSKPYAVHLIGSLQSNKLTVACDHFDGIQSIDRLKLIDRLIDRQQRGLKIPDLWLQVNVGNEPQKAGASVQDTPSLIDRMRQEKLPLRGLMTIPPASLPPAQFYQIMCDMASEHGLSELSMGMSNDYAVAIHHGSTMVRVGTQIMGKRPQNPWKSS